MVTDLFRQGPIGITGKDFRSSIRDAPRSIRVPAGEAPDHGQPARKSPAQPQARLMRRLPGREEANRVGPLPEIPWHQAPTSLRPPGTQPARETVSAPPSPDRCAPRFPGGDRRQAIPRRSPTRLPCSGGTVSSTGCRRPRARCSRTARPDGFPRRRGPPRTAPGFDRRVEPDRREAAAGKPGSGIPSRRVTTALTGEAREAGARIAAAAREARSRGRPTASPACLIWGGETTVTLRGSGRGAGTRRSRSRPPSPSRASTAYWSPASPPTGRKGTRRRRRLCHGRDDRGRRAGRAGRAGGARRQRLARLPGRRGRADRDRAHGTNVNDISLALIG